MLTYQQLNNDLISLKIDPESIPITPELYRGVLQAAIDAKLDRRNCILNNTGEASMAATSALMLMSWVLIQTNGVFTGHALGSRSGATNV